MSEQTGGEQPGGEQPEPQPAPRRRGSRSRRVQLPPEEAPLATDETVVSGAEPPAPEAQVEGEAPVEAPARTSRGSRGGRGRSRRAAPAQEPPAGEAAEAPPPAEPDEPESEPLLLPSQTTIRAPRGRGRRGEGRQAGARQPSYPRPEAQRAPYTRPEEPRVQPRPATSPAQAPRRGNGAGGSVESLIARQNVLFEEFASQQAQTLREVQRAITGAGRGGAPTGSVVALPKVAIFLDVPNLIYAAEQMGARVHFGKLLDYLTEGRQLVRATAYAPITDDPTTRFESQRFVMPVINQGWKVVTKSWKRFADGSMKANFDIELAVDILTMSDRLDVVVLLSGDGDFRRVCELVESKGVRVEVVAFAASTAMELRSVADQYTDLGQILNLVGY